MEAGEYVVQVVKEDGHSLTKKGQGTSDTDSDVDPDTGKTDVITLEANREITNVDAGLVEDDTYKVVYKFEPSKEPNMPSELPQGVKDQLPEAKENLEDGAVVPTPKDFTGVEDEVNRGTWSFEKWDKDSVTINKDTIGEDRTEEVTGYWKFTPKTEYKVTHEFKSGTEGKKLPEEVNKLLPAD